MNAQFSADYVEFKWLADSLYHEKKYDKAVIYYQKICNLNSFIPRFDYHNTACCYCKLNKPDSAFFYLLKGAKKGERFSALIDIDSDKAIEPVRKLNGWDSLRGILIDNMKGFEHSPKRNDSLRKVLLAIEVKDQAVRKKGIPDSVFKKLKKTVKDSIWAAFDSTDKRDQVQLKAIIQKFGWPTLEMVGTDGENAAWLIAQHSDRDTVFQVACLVLMRKAMLEYNTQLSNLAYLEDRVLVNRGKPQIYGTQCTEKNGRLVPRPIWDEKNVNKRRRAMTLGNIEDYLSWFQKGIDSGKL